jgi:hypothetical protein
MIMRTFQSVFPYASLWRGPKFPGFYLIGTQEPLRVPLARFCEAFKKPRFVADIQEWDHSVPSCDAMASLLLLNAPELAEYLEGVRIITDNHPYTEFPLWRRLSDENARRMYDATGVLRWKEERDARSK